MKTVNEILQQRVTCRRYERQSLTTEQKENIYAAIRNTPTSFNAQNYTVIAVEDQDEKERIYEITGQKQVKTCALFLVFCIDYNKILQGAKAKGIEMPKVYNRLDGIVDGTINTSLALMSALVSAESMGLGTCPIGYARTANPDAIAEVLDLPKHVMVVCGLAIGVPREHNDLKPKQPVDLIVHADRYRKSGIAEDIIAYDAEVTRYNETRAGDTTDNDWVAHMVHYYREMEKLPMLDEVRMLGFDVRG